MLRGHAIDARVDAQGRRAEVRPLAGPHRPLPRPSSPGVRVDSGVAAGTEEVPLYDPMMASSSSATPTRERHAADAARARGVRDRGRRDVAPVPRGAPLTASSGRAGETCRDLLEDPAWLKGLAVPKPAPPQGDQAAAVQREYTVEVAGKRFEVAPCTASARATKTAPSGPGGPRARRRRAGGGASASNGGASGDTLHSPLQGNVSAPCSSSQAQPSRRAPSSASSRR